jgi:hypothetical protein
MANEKPKVPDLNCPAPEISNAGYYTSQQSQLNTTRKDKFSLVIDIPKILQPILKKEERYCHGGNLERLEMNIWGFVVPDIKINVMEKGYGGQVLKFSNLSRPVYPPITVNFTIDNRFDNYFILYKWLDIQNDEDISTFDGKSLDPNSHAHLNDYATTFTVYALDEYDKPTARWDYKGAFPSSLGAINSSQRETTVLEGSFTFEFSQLKMSLV